MYLTWSFFPPSTSSSIPDKDDLGELQLPTVSLWKGPPHQRREPSLSTGRLAPRGAAEGPPAVAPPAMLPSEWGHYLQSQTALLQTLAADTAHDE